MSSLRIFGIVPESIADGYGLRYTIFTQGCTHCCEGCHNETSWPQDGGEERDTAEIEVDFLGNPLLRGITLSGGEPFLQPAPLIELAKAAKGRGLDVWAWSGWTYEELLASENPEVLELLALCDVIVDGRFILAERSLALEWRGSKNQRVIDLVKTRVQGEIVHYERPSYATEFTVPKWG